MDGWKEENDQGKEEEVKKRKDGPWHGKKGAGMEEARRESNKTKNHEKKKGVKRKTQSRKEEEKSEGRRAVKRRRREVLMTSPGLTSLSGERPDAAM